MFFTFCYKNIAEIQARHDEMVADMKEECQKSENPRIDGLPQESSTPTKNEKDDGIINLSKAGSHNDANASTVRYARAFQHPKITDKHGEDLMLANILRSSLKA